MQETMETRIFSGAVGGLLAFSGCCAAPKSIATFTPVAEISVGDYPDNMVAVDFNRDGHMDLIVSSLADPTSKGRPVVNLLLGQGNGSFRSQQTTVVPRSVCDLITQNFNGDIYPDLFMVHCESDEVSLWLGQSDGGFVQSYYAKVGRFPVSASAMDFNQDRLIDIAVVSENSNEITVLFGDGHGKLVAQHPAISMNSGPNEVLSQDFDGDGLLDIVVAHRDTQQGEASSRNTRGLISVLRGHGDGSFETAHVYQVNTGVDQLLTGDFTGDGLADLVAVDRTKDSVSLLINHKHLRFILSSDLSEDLAHSYRCVADVDRDQHLDVIGYDPFRGIFVWAGLGEGRFSHKMYTPFPLPSERKDGRPPNPHRRPSAMVVDDFNGDHYPDVVVTDVSNSSLLVFLNTTQRARLTYAGTGRSGR